jgi:hypothetical protein
MKMRSKLFLPIALSCICSLAAAQEFKPQSTQSIPPAKTPQPEQDEARAIAAAPKTVPAANTNDYNPSSDRTEAATCTKNLEKIAAAIEAYRADHDDVPNWLSDLVTKYLSDTNVLICPVTTRTGLQSAFGMLDPKVYSSYLYEFTPTDIPAVVKGAWPGPTMTMRQWKRQQMKLAGSEVPLVRCLLHEPALNLSIGGKVYSSPVYWELNFTNATAKLEDFSPHE